MYHFVKETYCQTKTSPKQNKIMHTLYNTHIYSIYFYVIKQMSLLFIFIFFVLFCLSSGELIKRWGRVPFLPGPAPPPLLVCVHLSAFTQCCRSFLLLYVCLSCVCMHACCKILLGFFNISRQ